MGQLDILRAQVQEGAYTLTSKNLAHALLELDMRISGANCWMDATYNVDELLESTDYYSDAGKTQLVMRKEFTYGTGIGTIPYITSILKIFYNENGSEDSRVTVTINRVDLGVTDDKIEDCESPFTTSESEKI
jgi:hypothetical protein